MITPRHIRCVAAVAAVAVSTALAPAAEAGLLAPRTIDARTGHDAVEVGGAIGNDRAWAAFVQQTAGVDRLYVDYAHNGNWARPFLADRGSAVGEAGLAGSTTGTAVVVFTEQVNGKDVLFGRRLENGAGSPVGQISASGENVDFESLISHFARGDKLVMDGAGAAAVCYVDQVSGNNIIATLAPRASHWVEHVAGNPCQDIGMDSRGDVLSVGILGNTFGATRIVGGQVKTDQIAANVMDEPSVAVSSSGLAIALARDTNFHVVGFRNGDISESSPWQSLGRIDSNTVFDPGDSPEEPRATLDGNGNGLIIWHSNSMNDPKTAFSVIKAGQPQTATFLSKEAVDSFPYATMLAPGDPVAGFELALTGTTLFPFRAGLPESALTAAPGMAPTFLGSAAGLVSDGAGSLLVLLEQGQNPEHVVAVLGDYARPVLQPRTSTRKPTTKHTVTLGSGATDTFAALTAADVKWTLPRSVKGLAGTHGLRLKVRFSHAGRYTIKVTATGPNGSQSAARLIVKVGS